MSEQIDTAEGTNEAIINPQEMQEKPPKVSGDKTNGGQHVNPDKFITKLT